MENPSGERRKARKTPKVVNPETGQRAFTRPKAPVSRPVHRSAFSPVLTNKEPGMVYKLIAPSNGPFGPSYYEALGYQRVEKRDGGPGFAFGETSGTTSAVEYHGHVLMQISKERADEITEYGAMGGGGQAHLDEVESRVIDRGHMPDSSRGIRRRRGLVPLESYYTEQNDREPALMIDDGGTDG